MAKSVDWRPRFPPSSALKLFIVRIFFDRGRGNLHPRGPAETSIHGAARRKVALPLGQGQGPKLRGVVSRCRPTTALIGQCHRETPLRLTVRCRALSDAAPPGGGLANRTVAACWHPRHHGQTAAFGNLPGRLRRLAVTRRCSLVQGTGSRPWTTWPPGRCHGLGHIQELVFYTRDEQLRCRQVDLCPAARRSFCALLGIREVIGDAVDSRRHSCRK